MLTVDQPFQGFLHLTSLELKTSATDSKRITTSKYTVAHKTGLYDSRLAVRRMTTKWLKFKQEQFMCPFQIARHALKRSSIVLI